MLRSPSEEDQSCQLGDRKIHNRQATLNVLVTVILGWNIKEIISEMTFIVSLNYFSKEFRQGRKLAN